DQPDAVLQREDTGRNGSGELADAVPDDRVRGDSPCRPEVRQRDLEGEERRLRIERSCEPHVVVAEERFAEIDSGDLEEGEAALERVAHEWLTPIERFSHT